MGSRRRLSVRMDSSRFGFVSWLVLAAAIDPQNGVPESVESTEPTETAEPTVPVIEERAGYGFSQQSPYYPPHQPHQPHQPNVPPHSPLVPNLLHSQIPTKQMEGNPSAFGPTGSAFHDVLEGPLEIPMEVLETNVDCQKSFMNIFFKLSRPFFGYRLILARLVLNSQENVVKPLRRMRSALKC